MNNPETNEEMKELLKQTIAPAEDAELRRDLWPRMLSKLADRSASSRRIPWFDWALAALAAATLIFFPGIIPALFYHL